MDWNNDGHLDIISGCYWTADKEGAHLQILKGKGDMDFEKAESILNVAGQPLQNLKLDEDGKNQVQIICTEQHAVDYDGDGDLDLVVGCFGPEFFLYENVSQDASKFEIAEDPTQLEIKSTGYHSAPHLVDWDGDGDLDLLSGSGDGGAIISENIGTRQKPKWSAFKQLVAPSQLREQSSKDEIKMAPSTRIWVTDFNKDGLLDLLVGDSVSLVDPKEGLSDEEFKQKREAHTKAMEEIGKKQQALYPKYQEYAEKGEEVPEDLQKEMNEIGQEFSKLYQARSEFQTEKTTGHVWVLIRKADGQQINAPNESDLSKAN